MILLSLFYQYYYSSKKNAFFPFLSFATISTIIIWIFTFITYISDLYLFCLCHVFISNIHLISYFTSYKSYKYLLWWYLNLYEYIYSVLLYIYSSTYIAPPIILLKMYYEIYIDISTLYQSIHYLSISIYLSIYNPTLPASEMKAAASPTAVRNLARKGRNKLS